MRRRYRAIIPAGVAAALLVLTLGAHAIELPDPEDASFLSPASDAGDGARDLADRLRDRGVTIDRVTTTPDAISALRGDPVSTVFVTTPGLVLPSYLRRLAGAGAGSRVVLVAPDAYTLDRAGIDAEVGGPRWTAAAVGPGCPIGTGPVALRRYTYDAGGQSCYGGGLAEFNTGGTAITLLGAADPFRNDRIGEHDNGAFAELLLARTQRVIWLDLHEREEPPEPPPAPVPTYTDPAPTATPAYPPETREPDGEGSYPPGSGEGGEPQANDAGSPPNPLWQAFPPSLWAALVLLVLAAIAVAAAFGRRLGAPVPEPLPARVRAAETVRGLAGLYRRANARDASLATLQTIAVRRLAHHYGVPADDLEAVAQRVAATTGHPVPEVRALLGAGVEDTDADLAVKATAVQNLVRYVTGNPMTGVRT